MNPNITRATVLTGWCPRCGADEHELDVRPFWMPMYQPNREGRYELYTHWAMCPELNEPLMFRLRVETEPAFPSARREPADADAPVPMPGTTGVYIP